MVNLKFLTNEAIKIFLLFIVSIGIQSWTKADDISEFEIEGFSYLKIY